MLVCSVSQRARRTAIAATVAEITAAVDATATGNVVFATLVDDPASVGDRVDAFLGEIMVEAASATDTVSVGSIRTTTIIEPTTASDLIPVIASLNAEVSETVTADSAQSSGIDVNGAVAETVTADSVQDTVAVLGAAVSEAATADSVPDATVVSAPAGKSAMLPGVFVNPSTSSWANAFTTLTTAFATEAAGDTLYVAHDHAESTAGAVTLTSSGTAINVTKIVCVNRAGSVPPVSADRRATAQVATTGANSITLNGVAHYDGLIFNAGNSTNNASILVAQTQGTFHRFDNCSLRIVGTGVLQGITFGAAGVGGNYVEFNNTTVSFGNAAGLITAYARFKWRNTPSALLGTIPTGLFTPSGSRGGSVECIGVDFSAAGSGKTIVNSAASSQSGALTFVDCKFDAAVTISAVPLSAGALEPDFVRCGSSGVNYTVRRHRSTGLLIEETTIVRTGGASDGTTTIAWKIVTTTDSNYTMPFECPPIAIWNDVTGSAVIATVEGIWGGGAVPNDDDIWLDVEYLGDASSPQGSFVNDGKADLLTTAAGQTSSSETWGGSTTKFKLAVTFTPQQKGWVYARVKCAKPSSTFYVDPLVTLT
jgi:hypothetical protein